MIFCVARSHTITSESFPDSPLTASLPEGCTASHVVSPHKMCVCVCVCVCVWFHTQLRVSSPRDDPSMGPSISGKARRGGTETGGLGSRGTYGDLEAADGALVPPEVRLRVGVVLV
jgi:hypothetical protein